MVQGRNNVVHIKHLVENNMIQLVYVLNEQQRDNNIHNSSNKGNNKLLELKYISYENQNSLLTFFWLHISMICLGGNIQHWYQLSLVLRHTRSCRILKVQRNMCCTF
ncbi:hypothetical protein PFHG_02986 [Plasmodium falciparum HB3]|uniref:Uncharacterized protein n=1 Tax=Plasmodium falciparum (isolate HB3) TaxID=137071 RepID=A0A0L7KEC3_PLAFX|nr:hypothetical protein PFHG_02986 [Plasmodium falciparum HB3]